METPAPYLYLIYMYTHRTANKWKHNFNILFFIVTLFSSHLQFSVMLHHVYIIIKSYINIIRCLYGLKFTIKYNKPTWDSFSDI